MISFACSKFLYICSELCVLFLILQEFNSFVMNETSTPMRSARIQNPHLIKGSSSIKSIIEVNTCQETPAMKAKKKKF